MTISTTHAQNIFSGNGSTTVFNFTFQILDKTHIEALIGGAVQSPSGYAVVINSDQVSSPGGMLTFNSAPTTGTNNVKVRRVTPQTQATSLASKESRIDTLKLTDAVDKLTLIVQELARRLTDLGG